MQNTANVMVQAFIDAVENGVDLVPVVADSTSTAKIAPFIKHFPDRLVNVGIAEQSMVGMAAGLALGESGGDLQCRAIFDFPRQ